MKILVLCSENLMSEIHNTLSVASCNFTVGENLHAYVYNEEDKPTVSVSLLQLTYKIMWQDCSDVHLVVAYI